MRVISVTPALLAIFFLVGAYLANRMDGTGPVVAAFFAALSIGVWMVEAINAGFAHISAERTASAAQRAKDKAE